MRSLSLFRSALQRACNPGLVIGSDEHDFIAAVDHDQIEVKRGFLVQADDCFARTGLADLNSAVDFPPFENLSVKRARCRSGNHSLLHLDPAFEYERTQAE